RDFKFCFDYTPDRQDKNTKAGQLRHDCPQKLVHVVHGTFTTRVTVEFADNAKLGNPDSRLVGAEADGTDIGGELTSPLPIVQKVGDDHEGALTFAFTVPYIEKAPLTESFKAVEEIKKDLTTYTDVDLLWVVDNSSSMKSYQDAVAQGLVDIAQN